MSMTYGKYLVIWAWLIVLLAAGTFTSSLPISKTQAALVILAVSLVKTGLVAWFYMHMKDESVPIWAVAIFPLFLVGLAALVVLLGLALA